MCMTLFTVEKSPCVQHHVQSYPMYLNIFFLWFYLRSVESNASFAAKANPSLFVFHSTKDPLFLDGQWQIGMRRLLNASAHDNSGNRTPDPLISSPVPCSLRMTYKLPKLLIFSDLQHMHIGKANNQPVYVEKFDNNCTTTPLQ